MANSSSPKSKALIQNCQRTVRSGLAPLRAFSDSRTMHTLKTKKGLFWKQPYKSNLKSPSQSPLMTSALSHLQSPSRWGLTVGKDCTHAAMRERELSKLGYKYNLQKVSSMNPACLVIFLKKKQNPKKPLYCNPGCSWKNEQRCMGN